MNPLADYHSSVCHNLLHGFKTTRPDGLMAAIHRHFDIMISAIDIDILTL